MRVALTVADFLNRAALVYGHRVAVVDEPSARPVRSVRSPTTSWRRGRGAWPWRSTTSGWPTGSGWPSSARTRPASSPSYFGVSGYGRILVPINFRLTADEIAYIVEHSGASVLLYDPDLAGEVDTIKVSHRFCLDGSDDAALFAPAAGRGGTAGVGGRRGRHLLGELHLGHHGAAQGRAADASQLLAQRGDVRVAHRRQRPRRAVAHVAHVPLQRLGDALRGDGHGRHTHRAAQGGRRGDPVAHRAPRGDAAVRRAGGGGGHPRARRRHVRPTAGPCPGGARVRIVVAGAPPPSKTIERVETELGWEFIQIYGLTETAPLLTINRAPAEWDDAGRRRRARSC